MGRSRLNPKFKVAGAVGAVIIAGAGTGLYWRLKHKDPAKYINAGDIYQQQNDLPDALAAYSFASGLRPTDPQIHLKIAKVHDRMRDQDFTGHVNAAIDEYTRAAEIDTGSKEAWQGLLDTNMAAALATSQNSQRAQENLYLLPQRFGIARDAARQLLALDANDYKARVAIPILTINVWLLNLPIPPTAQERALPVDRQPTETQRIDQAVAELTAIMPDHPENADLPYWIAQARIQQGINLMRQGSGDPTGTAVDPGAITPAGGTGQPGQVGADGSAGVRAAFAAAATAFDASIARLPANAQLRFKKFEVLTRLAMVDRDPESLLQYQEKRREALGAAQSLVTPADGPLYVGYKMKWADFIAAGDVPAAEAVYKQLLDRPTTAPAAGRPPDGERVFEDAEVRYQYAKLLERNPARWNDALAVLDGAPATVPAGLPASQQPAVSRMLAGVRMMRAQVLIDQYESLRAPDARAAKARAAQDEVDAVRGNPRYSGEFEVLKTLGRLQLVTGAYRDAVQTLSTAADRLAGMGGGTDYELLGWRALASADAGQPGDAIKLLEEAVRNPPGSDLREPHVQLARLYLQQQNYDECRRQVGWLSERDPDDVRTLHLQVELANHDGDARAVAEYYGRLPERTPAEQAEKALVAVRNRNPTDAERLYELVLAARPGDPATAIRLSDLYGKDGKKGRANEVLQQSMDLHPESGPRLQVVKDMLNGATDDAIAQRVTEQVNAIKDPFQREVSQYKLAAHRGDLAGAVEHMERAHALNPDDKPVLADLFLGYLAVKSLDKAQGLVARLSELNVDQAHGQLSKVRLALARGDAAGAVTLGQQLTHDFPGFADSWTALGEALQAAGQLEVACQRFTTSLGLQGNAPDVIARLVDCEIQLGRLDDARRALAEARRKFPDVAVYRRQLVQVEMAYGDPETVLPIVDQGVASQPDLTDNWQVAAQAYAGAAQRRTAKGDAAGAAGFLAKARDLLARALARWPDDANFAAELGNLQARDGTDAGLAAAATTFRALGATPRWQGQALPDMLLGRMYLGANRPVLAEAPLRHALEVNPQSTEARVALADSLFQRRLADEALSVLAPAKTQSAVRGKYVDVLLALNRGGEAESDLLADLRAHPDDPVPGNLLAHVYAVQGKYDAAIDVATQTLRANPNSVGAYYVRGAAEAGRHPPDMDAAVHDLTAFRTAVPDNAQGRMALARVLLARRDVDGAIRELEAAVELAPDAREARLLLARSYLDAAPSRPMDADRVVTQALAVPTMAHDPEVQRVAAEVFLRAGENDRAVASIRDAMANTPDQESVLDEYLGTLLATKHYDAVLAESARFAAEPAASWRVFGWRGQARAAAGDVPGAVAEFTTALDRAGAAIDLGPSLAAAGQIIASLGVDRAVELIAPRSVNSVGWKVVLATCYNQGSDRARGLATIEAAMPLVDTLPAGDQRIANRLAAQLYMTADPPQPDRAVALFQSVLKGSPDDLDALNDLACLLAEQVQPPRPAEALAYSQRAMDVLAKSGGASPFLSDTQGWMLILNGRLDEGIDVLHQIVGTATFPDVHYHLAKGYLLKHDVDDAKRELGVASQMYRSADARHQPLDQTLPGKIAAAQKEAQALTGGKSAGAS